MSKRKFAVAAVCAAVASILFTAAGDDYQFIISGYPAANPSDSDVSPGTNLVVGVLASASASDALEARAWTYGVSSGTGLTSEKRVGTVIVFK